MKRWLNKVIKPRWIYGCLMIIFLASSCSLPAQDSVITRPPVTRIWKEYRAQVLHDSLKKMVALSRLIPDLVLDLRYAGRDNFMKRRMYAPGTAETFLRAEAATALARVQQALRKDGLGLKVFDAYRPFSVTELFWELVQDDRYVANPARGSAHNRGLAVDVTIIDLATNVELEMGTGFDNFTDTAHHSFGDLSPRVIENRKLLKNLMKLNGFRPLDTEWWHYTFGDTGKYELLDISFRDLLRKEL